MIQSMTPTDTGPPVVLAIAGTDSGGAAGLAADLATIGHLGAHAACVVTAVTAQDTTGVHDIHQVPWGGVAAQLDAVLGDLAVSTVKTGMLGTPAVVELVADRVAHLRIVVDPVLVATSGAVLGGREVVRAYRRHLAPLAAVITPNHDEAMALIGRDEPAELLAGHLSEWGCAVVLTGGEGGLDWLALPGESPRPLTHVSVETANDHGTGCTHSSALATHLALGRTVAEAANRAAIYTAGQLRLSRTWDLGRGRGPVAHTTHGGTP